MPKGETSCKIEIYLHTYIDQKNGNQKLLLTCLQWSISATINVWTNIWVYDLTSFRVEKIIKSTNTSHVGNIQESGYFAGSNCRTDSLRDDIFVKVSCFLFFELSAFWDNFINVAQLQSLVEIRTYTREVKSGLSRVLSLKYLYFCVII